MIKMNDFTKEELLCARDALELWNSKHICSDMRNLNIKIQSMIDNYQQACNKSWPSNMIPPCPECKKFHDE